MKALPYLGFDGTCAEAFRFGMATDRFGIPWMINCSSEA